MIGVFDLADKKGYILSHCVSATMIVTQKLRDNQVF